MTQALFVRVFTTHHAANVLGSDPLEHQDVCVTVRSDPIGAMRGASRTAGDRGGRLRRSLMAFAGGGLTGGMSCSPDKPQKPQNACDLAVFCAFRGSSGKQPPG